MSWTWWRSCRLYVRQGLQCNQVDFPSSPDFQSVGIGFALSRRSSLIIVTAYRPPDSDSDHFVNYMDAVLSRLPRAAASNICLVGDFNAKHSSWLPSQTTDAAGARMFTFAVSNGLAQVVSDATYTTSSGKDVQLDLMFVNQPLLVQSCSTLAPVADHCPTLMRLSARNGLHRAWRKSYCTWDYQNADVDSLREALQRVDWSVLHSFSDPTEAVDVWSRLFHSLLMQYIPQKKVKTDPQGKPCVVQFVPPSPGSST